METPATIRTALRQGDWTTSIDLKDAYFHIPIHQSSKRYLRFVLKETSYQFQALCFAFIHSTVPIHQGVQTSISTNPLERVQPIPLSRRMVHRGSVKGIDDKSYGVHSKEVPRTPSNDHHDEIRDNTHRVFLGMDLNLLDITVKPAESKLSDTTLYSALSYKKTPLRAYLRLLGHMASLEKMIPLARLRIRPIQYHLAEHWLTTSKDMMQKYQKPWRSSQQRSGGRTRRTH